MGYKSITFNGTPEEVREQWLEERRKGIGGSDAATVLGLNNYATPYTLWLEKTGRALPDDLSDNEKVYWGNVLEDVIIQEFAKRHQEVAVWKSDCMYMSEEHPFMFASTDAMISNDGVNETAVLEIKTCGERRRSDWDDGVPPYYLAQVNHYLAVTGLDTAYVAVLIGGQEYREYVVQRDEDDINYLIAKEREFWQMVEDDQMPPFTGSAIDNQALMNQFPNPDKEYIQALDDDVRLEELESIKNQIKALETDKKVIESELRSMIGGHKGVETPRYRCTWSRSESSQLDTKRLKEEQPELCEKYTKTVNRDSGLRVTVKK